MSEPIIHRGQVLIYRVFDIAEEIDLVAVEGILRADHGRSRLSLARNPQQTLVMRNPPVRLRMGEADLALSDGPVKLEVFATLFDYGVLSLMFQIPIVKGTTWGQLVRLGETLSNHPATLDELNQLARKKGQELVDLLGPALKTPAERKIYEDYIIYFFEEIEGVTRAKDLLERADVPALILGEGRETLAPRSRELVLENVYQYAENDLVVLDWNSAIVLEPAGQKDIADVLEFALTHLLEFQYYDDVLDRRLSELYDAIEQQRKDRSGRFAKPWRKHFAVISQDANTRFLEFSELIERIDNSLKMVGDFYLAGIFRAGLRRFRIQDWQQSVTRKMNLLAQVSQLLQGEINVQRGHTLEMIVIALIAIELISAVIRSM